MWNCDWEYENQETLKQWYEEKISGAEPGYVVWKIICKGCGRMQCTAETPAASGHIARALRIRREVKLITCRNRNKIKKYAPDTEICLLCPAFFENLIYKGRFIN